VETNRAVFRWIVGILVQEWLLSGQTVSTNATVLEANAAMKSIVRMGKQPRSARYLKE
jgi:hypothetical protein